MENSEPITIEGGVDVKCYQVVFNFEDGCEYQMHGKLYDADWKIAFPQGVCVTCPHGQTIEIGSGSEEDILRATGLVEGGNRCLT